MSDLRDDRRSERVQLVRDIDAARAAGEGAKRAPVAEQLELDVGDAFVRHTKVSAKRVAGLSLDVRRQLTAAFVVQSSELLRIGSAQAQLDKAYDVYLKRLEEALPVDPVERAAELDARAQMAEVLDVRRRRTIEARKSASTSKILTDAIVKVAKVAGDLDIDKEIGSIELENVDAFASQLTGGAQVH